MKIPRVCLLWAAVALVSLAASSYKVSIPSDLTFGDAMLKPGEYTVSLEGKESVFRKGKELIRIPVVVDKNAVKFSATSVEITGTAIQAIDLGGTDIILLPRSAH